MSVPALVPDFFTLPEAGRILRIGRNSAYKLATEFEKSGGETGLPFVRLGKLKRVPRLALEKLHGGPITWPLADDDLRPAPDTSCASCAQAKRSSHSSTTSTRHRDVTHARADAAESTADQQLGRGF